MKLFLAIVVCLGALCFLGCGEESDTRYTPGAPEPLPFTPPAVPIIVDDPPPCAHCPECCCNGSCCPCPEDPWWLG